jgi:hypothetical protein
LAQQYQRKTDKQHILDNPDTYIGSVENVDAQLWVWDDAAAAAEGVPDHAIAAIGGWKSAVYQTYVRPNQANLQGAQRVMAQSSVGVETRLNISSSMDTRRKGRGVVGSGSG